MLEVAGQRRREGGEMLLQVSALGDRPRRGRAGIDDRKARMRSAHIADENAVVAAQVPGLEGQIGGTERTSERITPAIVACARAFKVSISPTTFAMTPSSLSAGAR